jgi:hypothetical protein
MDAADASGAETGVGDGAALDQQGSAGAKGSAGEGGRGTGVGGAGSGGRGGTGGTGTGGTGTGAAGGAAPDASVTDTSPTDQGPADQEVSDGNATDSRGMSDADATVVAFPCGPCATHWICGGAADAGQVDIMLTLEEDGCYLSGLSGHKLLGSDGTITEGGAAIGKVMRFGPQVGLYYPDGSQWLYCGTSPLCPAQQ